MFQSRIIYSESEYNGNSVNWKPDWFKLNEKSSAEIVAKNANKNVNVQVKNYPWKVVKSSNVTDGKSVVMNCDTKKYRW